MALTLQSVFERTRQQYHLELICGSGGMNHLMNWVYIAEDLENSDFLSPGELVITTGMCSQQTENWLYQLVRTLISSDTCGLILNTGKYLFPEDITPEIIELCDKHSFPIMTMPWNTRIFDITHDYYNRIFLDTQNQNTLSSAFSDLLFQRSDSSHTLSFLLEAGYPSEQTYTILYVPIFPEWSSLSDKISLFLEQHLHMIEPKSKLCTFSQYFCIILPLPDIGLLKRDLSLFFPKLRAHFGITQFYGGIGNQISSLTLLSECFSYARSCSSFAVCREDGLQCFDDLGFVKLLFSIKDRNLMQQYVNEQLGAVLHYDELHHSALTETLHHYLLEKGSIQQVAQTMFCHRNTILYRVRILKEELGSSLDSSLVCFSLMAAFEIRSYLALTASPEEM